MMNQDLVLADSEAGCGKHSSANRFRHLSASELEVALPLQSGLRTVGLPVIERGCGLYAGKSGFW